MLGRPMTVLSTVANQAATVFTDSVNAKETVTIKVTDQGGAGVEETLTLTVLDQIVIGSPDGNYPDYQAGETINLTITGGTEQYNIASSNTAVVSGSTATLKAEGPGTAIITVTDKAHPRFQGNHGDYGLQTHGGGESGKCRILYRCCRERKPFWCSPAAV